MVNITYENFRDVECEYVKYVTQVGNNFLLRIVIFSEFKRLLFKKFDEEQIKWFFNIFPHVLDTEITGVDKIISVKLAIESFDDLHLIEVNSEEYVLFDDSSDYFECWDFPKDIVSQPIPFERFMHIAFEDLALGSTIDMISNIEYNIENRETGQDKYVEPIRKGLYI